MKQFLQHHLNSMHVYCRLVDLGVKRGTAKSIAKKYETVVHRLLY